MRWVVSAFTPCALAVTALLAAPATSAGAGSTHGTTPRPLPWVRHTESYPGALTRSLEQVLSPRAPAPSRVLAGHAGAAATVPAVGLGSNLQINVDSQPPVRQFNPTVAASLDDPLVAVAAANDSVGASYQIMRTRDGGRTWRSVRQTPQLPTGEPCSGRTPSLDYSRRDHAFYLAAACATSAGVSTVMLWRSPDGATWTPPALAASVVTNVDAATGVADPHFFYDWQRVAVDNDPTSRWYGRVYVTWSVFHILDSGLSDACPAVVASTDRVPAVPSGAVFATTVVGSEAPTANGVSPSSAAYTKVAVGPEGAVYAMYAQEGCNTAADNHVRVARSTDGGRRFTFPQPVDQPGQFADNPDPDDVLPGKSAALGISPSIAVSPTGTLEVAYQNSVDAARSGADIWVSRSTDQGRTWTGAPLSTGAVGQGARHDQFLSYVTTDPGGRFWAVWLDNRRDPANRLVDAFEATSSDDGTRWTSRRISTTSYDPEHTSASGSILGVDSSIAASRAAVYPVWTDARDNAFTRTGIGETDIYTDTEIRR